MGYIVLLLIFAILFLMAELVLFPGVSVAALLSVVCYGSAIYMGFDHSTTVGVVIVVVAILSAVVTTILSLRAKTWQRFALKQEIESKSTEAPEMVLQVGDRGVTLSRLSPMGKVEIEGKVYEAKSVDAYVDQRSEVEVVGFENFTVRVKCVEK
jgi:membrane-bound ClpP family serine protease